MDRKKVTAILLALAAAALYAVSIPVSKLLLQNVSPVYMSAFLYFGAGVGISAVRLVTGRRSGKPAQKLTRQDLPYTVGMIVLDIAAPIFLMLGLKSATAANVSLLASFEIVATALVALMVFKELISARLWVAIGLISLASLLLSFEDLESLHFSYGSLFVLAACVCWGFENNCTRKLSSKSTYEVVILKGLFSGLGAFIIALLSGESLPSGANILLVMLLGFVSYGVSIFLYVRAQRYLGAAKTSAYYALSPFIGTLLSVLLLHERLDWTYFTALFLMLLGVAGTVWDTLVRCHTHLHTHTIVHTHDGSTHTHTITHSHEHEHFGNAPLTNHHMR